MCVGGLGEDPRRQRGQAQQQEHDGRKRVGDGVIDGSMRSHRQGEVDDEPDGSSDADGLIGQPGQKAERSHHLDQAEHTLEVRAIPEPLHELGDILATLEVDDGRQEGPEGDENRENVKHDGHGVVTLLDHTATAPTTESVRSRGEDLTVDEEEQPILSRGPGIEGGRDLG